MASSVASCLTPASASTPPSSVDLPPSYAAFLTTPVADTFASRIREETVSFVGAALRGVQSPRKRKSRCADGQGGHRPLLDDDPKPVKRRRLHKIGKAVDAVLAAGVPENCCRRECFRLFSVEEILSRKAVRAAREWVDADAHLRGEVVRSRSGSGLAGGVAGTGEGGRRTRQNYVWRVKGQTVCAKMFALWHGVCKDTLYRKSARTKPLTGVVPDVVRHGNFRRPRHGKGRSDCATWLGQLFERLAEPFPQHSVRSRQSGEVRTKQFLPTGLFATLQSVYDYYTTSEAARQPPVAPVSFVTFRRAWLQQFFQVRSGAISSGSASCRGGRRWCGWTSSVWRDVWLRRRSLDTLAPLLLSPWLIVSGRVGVGHGP